MKSANLARRIEPQEEPMESPPGKPPREESPRDSAQRARSRVCFDRRTIEIRDQGFAPFRVR